MLIDQLGTRRQCSGVVHAFRCSARMSVHNERDTTADGLRMQRCSCEIGPVSAVHHSFAATDERGPIRPLWIARPRGIVAVRRTGDRAQARLRGVAGLQASAPRPMRCAASL